MAILRLESVSKSYACKGKTVKALDEVSLSVERSEFIAILGPSGAGKTTLLNIAGLMDRPDSGKYLLDSSDTAEFAPARRAELLARKTGFIFQAHNLLPYLTAGENVGLGLHYAGLGMDGGYIKELFKLVGLEGLEDRKPAELSAGQQQRVAIARAMAKRPELILADEPTGNLDETAAAGIMRLFKELNRLGATVLLVTHNRGLAGQASRVIEMSGGRIVSDTRQTAESGGAGSGAVAIPLPAGGLRGGGPWAYSARSAFRSIRRHPLKNLFMVLTIAAAFFASAYFELIVSDFKAKKNRALADPGGVLIMTPSQDPRPGKLTLKDMGALRALKSIINIYPAALFYADMAAKGKSYKAVVHAQTPWLIARNGITVHSEGRLFSDFKSKDGEEVLIGEELALSLFGLAGNAPGKIIIIKNSSFRVSGVFRQGKRVFFSLPADNVIMPFAAALKHGFITGADLSAIYAVTRDFASAESDGREIAALLASNHKIKSGEDYDFNIISARCRETPAEIEQGLNDFRKYYLYIVLGSLLGLSMVVVLALSGGKKEILTLKSLGCRRLFAVAQIFFEMLAVSLTGIAAGSGLVIAVRGFWGLNYRRFFFEPSGFIFLSLVISGTILGAAAARTLSYYRKTRF